MDRKILEDTFSIIQTLKKCDSFNTDFDTQVNILLSLISIDLNDQNMKVIEKIKTIIDDKLPFQEIKDKKSFYLGKLSGTSQMIGQIKKIIDFDHFVNELTDKEVNLLLELYSKKEIISKLESNKNYMLEESSNHWNELENKELVISNQLSNFHLRTLSYKGSEVINLIHKKKRHILYDAEFQFAAYKDEKQIEDNNLSKNKYIKGSEIKPFFIADYNEDDCEN
ncbi:Uncharacterised protein [Lysinibacillus capsici]|uniref:Uncharacterized protein n=1 Tax=Lysinibacillus capsici TaxID=2115968 RepID=A0A2X1A480_9BACI|nr:hypothetical protein [Lysinibacillus capsici]SPU38250.1 Uncharacterised protein [Lysinibacillus capsici]